MKSDKQAKLAVEQVGVALAEALFWTVRLAEIPEDKVHDTLDEFYEGVFNVLEDRLVGLGVDQNRARDLATEAGEYGSTWLDYIYPPKPAEPA